MANILLRVGMLLAASTLAWPAQPQPSPSSTPTASWMNAGSDVPVDENWRLGTLPNGLRYAIRRNGQPNMMSIRVRIGVGALMESDSQQGWTHLLEHMTFRRTANFPDGEGPRIWQRLGVRFGSDTNAATTHHAVNYVLDLPKSDPDSYSQALRVLADMVDNATIDAADLDGERKVVIAERAIRLSPALAQVRAIQSPLFNAGTKIGARDIIGTEASLNTATPEALRAYYEAWFRPSKAVIVVVANADPAALEAGIRAAFGGWQGTGPEPAAPDWGKVTEPPSPAAVVVQPQLPESVQIAFVSPHDDSPFTLARLRRQFAEVIARSILTERLGRATLKGEAIIGTGINVARQRHGGDHMLITLTPRPGQWQAALNQGFGVLNGAAAEPPAQEEIDQQIVRIMDLFRQNVANAGSTGSASWANRFITDFANGEVTPSPASMLASFTAARPSLTPLSIGTVMRDLLKPAPRLLVLSPVPLEGGAGAATRALAAARAIAPARNAAVRAVSLDQLQFKGKPATVVGSGPIAALGAERIQLSNGTELILKRTGFERDRVRIAVQLGHGLLSQPQGEPGPLWSAGALRAGGIGPFTPEELSRLAAGRQISFSIASGATATTLSGISTAVDFADMLKLMAGQIEQPQFADVQLSRLRDTIGTSYNSIFSQPGTVMQAFAGPILYGGDTRFQTQPALHAVKDLTLPTFQRYWSGILGQGPRRVVVVGAFERDAMIAAISRTLGTIAVPRGGPAPIGADLVRAKPSKVPAILHHQGDPSQVLVVRGYPTLGLVENRKDSLGLVLAAALVQTRLNEIFRAQQGATYTPAAAHNQVAALSRYGVFLASAQTLTSKAGDFDTTLNSILSDLATNGPTADAFKRVKDGQLIAMQRSRSDNGWWLGVLQDELDPARIEAITSNPETLNWLTPEDVKAVIARYLVPANSFTLRVMPTDPAARN